MLKTTKNSRLVIFKEIEFAFYKEYQIPEVSMLLGFFALVRYFKTKILLSVENSEFEK